MMDLSEAPLFKELDGGTLFTAQQIWRNETTGQIESCVGVWEWAQAASVITSTEPPQFPEITQPMCSVLWMGQYLHLLADYQTVQLAYRRYKKRYGGQYIRLLAN